MRGNEGDGRDSGKRGTEWPRISNGRSWPWQLVTQFSLIWIFEIIHNKRFEKRRRRGKGAGSAGETLISRDEHPSTHEKDTRVGWPPDHKPGCKYKTALVNIQPPGSTLTHTHIPYQSHEHTQIQKHICILHIRVKRKRKDRPMKRFNQGKSFYRFWCPRYKWPCRRTLGALLPLSLSPPPFPFLLLLSLPFLLLLSLISHLCLCSQHVLCLPLPQHHGSQSHR